MSDVDVDAVDSAARVVYESRLESELAFTCSDRFGAGVMAGALGPTLSRWFKRRFACIPMIPACVSIRRGGCGVSARRAPTCKTVGWRKIFSNPSVQ